MWNIKARVASIVIGVLGANSNNLEKHTSRRSLAKTWSPNWQRQQYLAVHTSYERCSISQNPGKTPRSEKNTLLNTRVEWRTRDNNDNNMLLRTRGPYRRNYRHKSTKVVRYTSARITESMFAHDQHWEEQNTFIITKTVSSFTRAQKMEAIQ